MFDAITEKPKPRRWQTAVIIGSAAVHAAVIAGVVVGAMWQVDKLDLTSNVDVTMRVPPPPGDSSPPPAAGTLEVQKEKRLPPKVLPKDMVQKTEVKDPEPPKDTGGGSSTNGQIGGTGTDPTATGTCPAGNCTGGGGDDPGGDDETKPECADGIDNDKDGKIDGGDPACASGKTAEDQDPTPVVPPGVSKGLRMSGNENIYPPEMVRVEMMHQDKKMVQATVQLCVSKGGAVDSVRLLKKTGFQAYDEVLVREIREWKYRPYLVGGKPSPMCTVAVIIYRMK